MWNLKLSSGLNSQAYTHTHEKKYCGGLNESGIHKLIGSMICGFKRIMICGLGGIGVTLLEEVCH